MPCNVGRGGRAELEAVWLVTAFQALRGVDFIDAPTIAAGVGDRAGSTVRGRSRGAVETLHRQWSGGARLSPRQGLARRTCDFLEVACGASLSSIVKSFGLAFPGTMRALCRFPMRSRAEIPTGLAQ
jgi:hypothetical protein